MNVSISVHSLSAIAFIVVVKSINGQYEIFIYDGKMYMCVNLYCRPLMILMRTAFSAVMPRISEEHIASIFWDGPSTYTTLQPTRPYSPIYHENLKSKVQ
jgi:hypothetical protein